MKLQKKVDTQVEEKIKLYVDEVNKLIEKAEKDDIVIRPCLRGNVFAVQADMMIRPKTAEEKLAELQKLKEPVQTKKKK